MFNPETDASTGSTASWWQNFSFLAGFHSLGWNGNMASGGCVGVACQNQRLILIDYERDLCFIQRELNLITHRPAGGGRTISTLHPRSSKWGCFAQFSWAQVLLYSRSSYCISLAVHPTLFLQKTCSSSSLLGLRDSRSSLSNWRLNMKRWLMTLTCTRARERILIEKVRFIFWREFCRSYLFNVLCRICWPAPQWFCAPIIFDPLPYE